MFYDLGNILVVHVLEHNSKGLSINATSTITTTEVHNTVRACVEEPEFFNSA